MTTVGAQRAFLQTITDDTAPVVFAHLGLSHSVYVTRMAGLSPYKFEGRVEPVCQLTMVATAAEASGASTAEQFLLDAANDVTPLVYVDRNEERHYVYLTRLAKTMPYKDNDRYEPVYGVTMVDARAVQDVQGVEGAKIAAVAAVSLYRQVMTWDVSLWDFSQWN